MAAQLLVTPVDKDKIPNTKPNILPPTPYGNIQTKHLMGSVSAWDPKAC